MKTRTRRAPTWRIMFVGNRIPPPPHNVTVSSRRVRTGDFRPRHRDVGVVGDAAALGQRERADHGDVVAAARELLEQRLESAHVTLQRQRHKHQHVGRGTERGEQRQKESRGERDAAAGGRHVDERMPRAAH